MGSKKNNILLVEDSSDDIELIKRKIRSNNIECELVIAKNGEEALNYLYRNKKYSDKEKFPDPDLILLDIRMPKVNGIEVLKAINADKKLKNIPVVMLTVSTIENDIFESFDNGCKNYITKSVGFERFEDTLKPVINYYLSR